MKMTDPKVTKTVSTQYHSITEATVKEFLEALGLGGKGTLSISLVGKNDDWDFAFSSEILLREHDKRRVVLSWTYQETEDGTEE